MLVRRRDLTFNECLRFFSDKTPERIDYENKLDIALASGNKEEANKLISNWIHRKE